MHIPHSYHRLARREEGKSKEVTLDVLIVILVLATIIVFPLYAQHHPFICIRAFATASYHTCKFQLKSPTEQYGYTIAAAATTGKAKPLSKDSEHRGNWTLLLNEEEFSISHSTLKQGQKRKSAITVMPKPWTKQTPCVLSASVSFLLPSNCKSSRQWFDPLCLSRLECRLC